MYPYVQPRISHEWQAEKKKRKDATCHGTISSQIKAKLSQNDEFLKLL